MLLDTGREIKYLKECSTGTDCFVFSILTPWLDVTSRKWLQFLSLTARKTKQTHVTSFVIVLNGTEAPLPKFVLLYYYYFIFFKSHRSGHAR